MTLRQPLIKVPLSEEPSGRGEDGVAPVAHYRTLLVIESTPDHAIGTCGDVSLYVWRRVTRISALPPVLRAFSEARRAGGGRFRNFGVVEAEASLPPSDVRSAIAHVMRDAAANIVASALTFEGTGFRASAVRATAIGMAMMARQPYLHRVFDSVPRAADWLVSQMRSSSVGDDEARCIEGAMQQLRGTPPT